MNEAETRAEYIDPALKAAGWGTVDGTRIRRSHYIAPGRIEGQGRPGQPLYADYVLEYRNTKLAVIEAKAWDEPLTLGLAQAKNYAEKMAIRYTYCTNGQGIYGCDMETGREGVVPVYPSPDELWELTFAKANAWRERFAAVPYPDKSGTWAIRFYQEISVNRVLEAIIGGRNRLLLTLATGTGKTSIAFQIAWKLFNARWNLTDWKSGKEPSRRPRILFLADRNNLADQALNDFTAFNAFAEDAMTRIRPEDIRRRGRVFKNASVFFTIFQTFMSGPEKDGKPTPYFGEYPPDFFDFIVIDECHRGGANDESKWRGIMEYFSPAVQLGLTATPKRLENADTYRYFGGPLYVYSLREGINDGYLTPFRVKQIATHRMILWLRERLSAASGMGKAISTGLLRLRHASGTG
jgi:type I restriction enzyme, R subunit